MTHVSRKKLDKKVLEQIMFFFGAILADLRTEAEVSTFLDSLLTNTEKLMLAKRLAMVVMLTEGVSDTQISQSLKTTYATIEKTKLLLGNKLAGYKVGLVKLKERKNWQLLRNALLELAKYAANPHKIFK
jgi:uncharacterized protein YerC